MKKCFIKTGDYLHVKSNSHLPRHYFEIGEIIKVQSVNCMDCISINTRKEQFVNPKDLTSLKRGELCQSL